LPACLPNYMEESSWEIKFFS